MLCAATDCARALFLHGTQRRLHVLHVLWREQAATDLMSSWVQLAVWERHKPLSALAPSSTAADGDLPWWQPRQREGTAYEGTRRRVAAVRRTAFRSWRTAGEDDCAPPHRCPCDDAALLPARARRYAGLRVGRVGLTVCVCAGRASAGLCSMNAVLSLSLLLSGSVTVSPRSSQINS